MALELFNQNPDFDFGEEFVPWEIDFEMIKMEKGGFLRSNLAASKLTLMQERSTGDPILIIPSVKDQVVAYGLIAHETDILLRRKTIYDQRVSPGVVDDRGWERIKDPGVFSERISLLGAMQDALTQQAWDDARVIEKPNKTVESIEAFDARYELNEVCEELLDLLDLLDELNDVREVNCYFTTLKTALIDDLELDVWEKVNETRTI